MSFAISTGPFRFHYVVIAGRRSDFNERTYRIRRMRRASNPRISLLHYDNVIDDTNQLLAGTSNY